MAQFIKFLTVLGQENVITSIGFTAGMVFTMFNDKQMCIKANYDNKTTDKNGNTKNTNVKVDSSQLSILKNPLSTLLAGSLNGLIYSVCASFVGRILPFSYRPLIPICLSISMINSAYKWTKPN